MKVSGSIFAAMLTPFNADGSLSTAGVAPLVDYVLSKGVDGLYASGSTGESVLQSRDERAALLSELGDYARDKCTLIAHVGSASTDEAVSLAKLAGEKGFHALSAVPPFYYKHSYSDIVDYYKAIVDASELPLIIYNIPVLSGVDIPTEKLLELLGDDRIAGVKFTAQDLFQFGELRKAAPDKSFYFGTDEMFLGAAAVGTDGGIGSTYNLIGDVYVGIQNAVANADMDEARRLQRKANDLIAILFKTGVLPGLKHALNRLGVPVGPCRKPFSAPSTESIKLLEAWMDEHKLLR
ncbi:MAG: N-acetylneuraminate lyase [Rhizobiaceae bacterium]|nr:N-acetylneuraminate lyase [Rhizobiaceae bacterium]